MTSVTESLLGILISHEEKNTDFPEKKYYERLSVIAKKENITAFVFSPEWVNWEEQSAFGFFFDDQKMCWLKKTTPLPKVIYDRHLSLSGKSSIDGRMLLRRLRTDRNMLFMNMPLSGKWRIHQLLQSHEELRPYLPNTVPYKVINQIFHALSDNGRVFLKPINGTHGLGIFCISKTADKAYIIQGRVTSNRSILMKTRNEESLKKTIESLTNKRRYIVQQALDLSTENGEVFDIRVLIQKASSENWHVTGSAVRLGAKGSITSNLHSGGRAASLLAFLEQHYDKATVAAIQEQIEFLIMRLPSVIEQSHGRLCELGVDIGVDRNGKVWLLEANSKPGRKIFELTGLTDTLHIALTRPILYAKYLMQRKIGG